MATNDSRSGFRLPWSGQGRDPGDTEGAGDGGESAGWPAADLAGRGETSPFGDRPAARPSKASARLAGDLASAIRSTGDTAREQAIQAIDAEASRTDAAIRSMSAADISSLQRRAEEEIEGIKEWSKQEIARIRRETDDHIVRRKLALDNALANEAADTDGRLRGLEKAVSAYRASLDAYVSRLAAEEDPVRLAALAGALPDLPALDPLAAARFVEHGSDPNLPVPAEGRTGGGDEPAPVTAEAPAPEPAAGAPAPEPAAAEAPQGGPRETRVVVTGLASVAGIASFKRQLGRLPGVDKVEVTSGAEGEFVVVVRHREDVPFSTSIPEMSGFAAKVTSEADGTVTVAASETESEG